MLGALLLITLGVLFLLNNLYPVELGFSRMWPIVLIVIGLVKIVEYFQRCSVLPSSTKASLPDAPSGNPDGAKERQMGGKPMEDKR